MPLNPIRTATLLLPTEAAPLDSPPLPSPARRWPRWLLGLVAAAIATSAWFTGRSLLELVSLQRQIEHVVQTVNATDLIYRLMLDAETGQRGFLLGGKVSYLEPYHGAVRELGRARKELGQLVAADPPGASLAELEAAIDAKLEHLSRSIALRGAGQDEEVGTAFESGDGLQRMDRVRSELAALGARQAARLAALHQQHEDRVVQSFITTGFSFGANVLLLGLLLARAQAAARAARRAATLSQAQNVELATLLSGSAAQNQHMRELSRLARFLQTCRDEQEATAVLAQRLPPLMQAERGAMYLMADSRNRLRLSFAWGDVPFVDAIEPHECWALRSGQPFLQPADGGATACAHLQHGPAPAAFAGMQCLPMAAHGELSGLLVLALPATAAGPANPDDTAERLRRTALEQVGLSLGNLALRESLRQQSIRDTLTGLVNRRYLDETLPREILRAERRARDGGEGTMAVLMVDIDHFKQFNDRHGHEVGDRVLRIVAQALARSTRASDLAARYGGEEFTVLLSDLSASVVLQRAEALRAAIEALPASTEGHAHGPITVSVGVAIYPDDGDTPERLLLHADQALYAAKRSGRNRVQRFDAASQPVAPAQGG